MAITYTTAVDGKTLIVEAVGADESLEQVQTYGLAVINAAKAHGCQRVLCIETELEYRLNTTDIFKSAAFIAAEAPDVVRVAIVCKAIYAADAAFWETVAVNRGVSVRMFFDRTAAEQWLYQR